MICRLQGADVPSQNYWILKNSAGVAKVIKFLTLELD
jgi:hypothetical protein